MGRDAGLNGGPSPARFDEAERRPGPRRRTARPAPDPEFDYETEGPWEDQSPKRGKLDGAIMELQALERRVELTGMRADRLPSIKTALRFLRVAADVDGAKCLRALIKAMTEWTASGVVKMQMYDLFTALNDLPGKGGNGDDEA